MGMFSGRVLPVIGAAAAISFTAPAWSQDGAAVEGADRATDYGDEILVTARRREERLQDVPIAVTVLSGEKIAQANITRTDELQKLAPGFSVTPAPFGNAALSPTIRSQRQPFTQLNFDQSVQVYFAEVVQARPIGLNNAFFDVSSVQVLKGPQGTLFGRNSTGGALLITPRAPDGDLGGYFRASFGNYDAVAIEGAANLPVSDDVRVRASGRYARRDGYIRSISTGRDLDDERTEAARLSVDLNPGGGPFHTLAVLDYLHRDDSGSAPKLLAVNPGGRAGTFYPVAGDLQALAGKPYHTTTVTTSDHGTQIDSYGLAVISRYEFGDDFTVKNVFGYRRIESFLEFDGDGTRFNLTNGTDRLDYRQYSDELQLLGKTLDGNLDFIVGGFLFRESGTDRQATLVFDVVQTNNAAIINKSGSVFAQATYRVPSVQGLSVTLGGRQTWDGRSVDINATRLGNCLILTADTGSVPISPCQKGASANFSKFTYTASIEFKPSDGTLLYAASKRGYRSGGFPIGPRRPAEFVPYKPEVVDEIELGFKADWQLAGMAGRTNVAAYFDRYKDIQRSISITEAGAVRTLILNAARANIDGFEIEQMLRPFPSLEINASYAYSNARYRTFVTPDNLDYSDSAFSGAPKHALGGSIRWTLPLKPEIGEVSLQGSGFYRSKTVNTDVTSFNPLSQTFRPFVFVPAYHTFDARLDWSRIQGSGLSAGVWIKNLTDEHYITGLNSDYTALGVVAGILGPPRTVGIDLRYDF